MPIIPASPNLGPGPTNQQGPFPQTGSTTPTDQQIGPLPASTMPGQLAQTIPVMANFQFILGQLNSLQNQINNMISTGPPVIHIDTTLPITGGPITSTGVIGHAVSGVQPGLYGDSLNVPQLFVDKFGHIDTVKNVPISSTPGQFIQADYVLYPVGNAQITNYRLLTAGANITLTDGGAQGPVTIAAQVASFFISGFTFGYGEPQNNQWIEFTPQTTVISSGSGTGGGGVSPGIYTQHRRLVIGSGTGSSNNGSGQISSGDLTSDIVWRGNGANQGGFSITLTQGIELNWAANSRIFIGLSDAAFPLPNNASPAEPSAYVITTSGAIGILKDSGDTHLQLFTNNGAGSSTKVDLGASFTPAVQDWYVVTLTANPNDTVISWSIKNTSTGASASGSTSTNLPPANKWLGFLRYADQGPSIITNLQFALGPYFWQNDY